MLRTVLTSPLAPPALRDDSGRVLVQPWNLDHDEYVEHAFDQLRQASLNQTEVVAALLRVLRMLITHVNEEGRPERAGALEQQMRLLLEAAGDQTDLLPEDLQRIESLASDDTDPADHSL